MSENPRRGRHARNFTTNVPKILVPKSSSEQIFSRKLPLGAPDNLTYCPNSKSIQDVPASPSNLFFTSLNKVQPHWQKRSSCENEISTIICLVHRSSPSVPRTRRIWLFRRITSCRQKERGKQQSIKIKRSLEIFWYPYDRTLKVLLVSRYTMMKKF